MKHKEQIERTIKYVRCLAEGTDPVTGEPATKETLDRPQTIRCFLFIEKILSEMIAKKKKKPCEPYPIEKLSDFTYEEDCGIVKLLNKLKKLVPEKEIKLPPAAKVNAWLADRGFICKKDNDWEVSERGHELGIYSTEKETYSQIMYNERAQLYIVSNFDIIMKETLGEDSII